MKKILILALYFIQVGLFAQQSENLEIKQKEESMSFPQYISQYVELQREILLHYNGKQYIVPRDLVLKIENQDIKYLHILNEKNVKGFYGEKVKNGAVLIELHTNEKGEATFNRLQKELEEIDLESNNKVTGKEINSAPPTQDKGFVDQNAIPELILQNSYRVQFAQGPTIRLGPSPEYLERKRLGIKPLIVIQLKGKAPKIVYGRLGDINLQDVRDFVVYKNDTEEFKEYLNMYEGDKEKKDGAILLTYKNTKKGRKAYRKLNSLN